MKKLILTMCLTAAGVFGAAAQMRLTLGEALDLALSENPTVKVAEMEVQRFDYVKRQTWGSWIPQISVGGTYTRSIVKQSMTKGLSFGADNTLAAQGDATWTLFAPAVFRTLILLPFALSFVVTGTVWAYMYRPTGGVLNSFLSLLGVNVSAAMKNGHLMWASSNSTIMLSIIIAMVWQFSGYVAVIFLAAIKNVPVNIINAAKLDGAYMPRIYIKLIIPQLKGAMGSCITILAMYALRSFDFIVSLVGYTTSSAWTLPIWMYNEAFQNNNFAYSAAISCFLLALVLVLILPLTYWTNRRK